MADSTKKKRPELGRHPRGYWYKKYQGRFYYFFKLEDDQNGSFSKEKWNHDKFYIDQGLEPPAYDPMSCTQSTTLTVKDLCNHWLATKETDLESGNLAQRTYDEYKATAELLLGRVGKTLPAKLCGPQKFDQVKLAIGKQYNANGQSKRITQIRSIFNTCYEDGILDSPPNFGRGFRKPKAKAMRKLRNAKGDQSYTPQEIHALLAVANVNLRAMILLGLQAGMGNEDCAALPRSAIKDGWLVWARVKNEIPRRVPLWKETIKAIEAAIIHADSKGESELCFIGARGKSFITPKKNGYRVTGVFDHARKQANINPDRTFYDLRRTFETIAGETTDQVAVDAIMGHIPSETNMSARYRQKIGDERLKAVVNHVRKWLGKLPKGGAK